jgi:hypothetical protein
MGWVLWLAGPLSALAAPSGDEIIAQVIARDKELVEHRKAFDYDLDIRREKLDASGAVVETTKEHQVVIGDQRPGYNTRSGPGGSTRETKAAAKEEPFALLKMIDHFTFTLEGQETVDGVLCYKVAFQPKPDMPYRNREEKVLNAVSGHVWASTVDYSLIKDEGTLMHPVSVGWIFATLEEMQFAFATMLLPNGEHGPRQVEYSYRVSIPFTSIHERDTRTMSNYRATGKP